MACALLLLLQARGWGAQPFDPQSVVGPKLEKLCMVIVANADAQILAAEKGELDIVSDVARPSDIDRLSRNPGLDMSLARGFHAFFLLLNNRVFPWNDEAVRQAAALALDRNDMVRGIYSGYCEPINSWLPPVSPWALPDSSRSIFDRERAKERLASRGYTLNLAGKLVAPDGKKLPVLKLLSPLARVAPTTAELSERIAESLNAVGFDVQVEPLDFSALVSRLNRGDYSLAVLAWSMGRNPGSLYSFYHSSMDVEGGYNVTGISDPQLDAALERLRFAPDEAAARAAAAECQEILKRCVPSVPVYSRFSVAAVSNAWKNVLSTDKITADNMWTFMRAEPKEGPMRMMTVALAEEPRSLNPFTASSAYAWQVLGFIYEGLLDTDPFTLSHMPGLAQSWDVETKGEGAARHTELTFRLKKGLKWNDGTPVTAHDMKATIDFIRRHQIPRFFDAVKDVESAEAVSDGELVVRMNGVSYWYLDNIAGLPYMPRRVVGGIKDWQRWNPLDRAEESGPFGLVGSGPFRLTEYREGEYVMMERNPHFRMLRKEAAE